MNLFPIVGSEHRRQLMTFLEKDTDFLEKWGLNPKSFDKNTQTLEKLLSHPRRMWVLLGESEQTVWGAAVFSFQGIPHPFAQLDLVLQSIDLNQFRFSVEILTRFGFQEMALQALQMTLLEGAVEKKNTLVDLGWSLDAVLKKERLWEGQWIDEYCLGRLSASYPMGEIL